MLVQLILIYIGTIYHKSVHIKNFPCSCFAFCIQCILTCPTLHTDCDYYNPYNLSDFLEKIKPKQHLSIWPISGVIKCSKYMML